MSSYMHVHVYTCMLTRHIIHGKLTCTYMYMCHVVCQSVCLSIPASYMTMYWHVCWVCMCPLNFECILGQITFRLSYPTKVAMCINISMYMYMSFCYEQVSVSVSTPTPCRVPISTLYVPDWILDKLVSTPITELLREPAGWLSIVLIAIIEGILMPLPHPFKYVA